MDFDVTDATFEKEVLVKSKEVPVVVDFWADWCGPCRMLKPVLEKLVKEFEGRFVLAKLAVDDNRETSDTFGVMSLPTVKLFKDGKEVDGFMGAQPEEKVRQWLEHHC